jgi:hypothetical protein
MMRRGILHRSRRGSYVLATLPLTAEDPWERRRLTHLGEVSALAGPDAVAGARSAAMARGLPVSAVPARPEVIRPAGSGTWPGVRVLRRTLDPDEIELVNGLLVTNVERTCVDVALDLPTPEALITVDAALRQGASLSQMHEMLKLRGPCRGCRTARRTLAWADGHSESPLESRGRGVLMMLGVPQPSSNVSFRLGDREVRADHSWKGLGIVAEADGRGKYGDDAFSDQPLWAERLRQAWMEDELGLFVVRYVDREIRREPEAVVARWRHKLAARQHQPWQPPEGLEIFQRPVNGSLAPIRWFRRRDEG